jgi:hypothetical protein
MKTMDMSDRPATHASTGAGARIAAMARLVAAAAVAVAGGIAHLSKARCSAAHYVRSARRRRL